MTQPNSISVTIGGAARSVRFDLSRLVAIEQSTGRTQMQLLSDFAAFAPDAVDGKEPTPEAVRQASDRFSVSLVCKFLAGCLDVPVADLGSQVPVVDFQTLYAALVPGYVRAIQELNGVRTDPPTAPPASAG